MKNQDTTIIVENSPTNGHNAPPVVETPTIDPVIVDPVTVETINIEADGSDQAQAKSRSPRMLYRHPTDKMAGGVAGGLAETFNLDPSLVRILWLVLTVVTGGGGLLAYLALWLFLPVGTADDGQQGPATLELNDRNMGRAAFLLIGLGVIWFLSNIGALPWLWSGFCLGDEPLLLARPADRGRLPDSTRPGQGRRRGAGPGSAHQSLEHGGQPCARN